MPFSAIPPGETPDIRRWAQPVVWTDRMLTTLLGNRVRGGKWHALIDKVYASKKSSCAGLCHGVHAVHDLAVDRVQCRLKAGMDPSSAALVWHQFAVQIAEPVTQFQFRAAEGCHHVVVPAADQHLRVRFVAVCHR
ncbi:MAG TPA: hypothetical protein DCX79_06740 [Planctomycetaceae bacterium]|nr:hypothetical protein [Planctomycetaceae bacterium]